MQDLAKILEGIFDGQPWDDSVERTAERLINFWQEYAGDEEIGFEPTVFECTHPQQIVVANIEFSSLCSHHLLPFYGVVHVGYLPAKWQIGVSKIPRIVQYYAKRPQVQERFTSQIASWIKSIVEPMGCIVVVKATHTCMSCRGIMSRNASMVTTELRGIYLTSEATKDEFWRMVGER